MAKLKKKGTLQGNFACQVCQETGEDSDGDNMSLYLEEDTYTFNGWCWKCGKYYSGNEFQTYANEALEHGISTISITNNRPNTEVTVKACESTSTCSISKVGNLGCLAIKDRRIEKETTKFYGIKSELDKEGSEVRRYYPIIKKDEVVGYKCRKLPKEFSPKEGAISVGDLKQEEFFGQSKFTNTGGTVIITCGEEDAMASYQMTKATTKNKMAYASISAPGASHIVKLTAANLEWLSGFDRVVFAVDQEKGDIDKATEACKLLKPGTAFIAKFDENDASDMLSKGLQYEFYKATWNAKAWSPEGIVLGSETWNVFKSKDYNIKGIPFPDMFGLNDKYLGMVKGNMDVIGAFEKAGKSTMIKEIILHVMETTEERMGLFMLEESIAETVTDLIVMKLKKRIDLDPGCCTDKEQKEAWKSMFKDNRIMLSTAHSFAGLEDVFNKIRYLKHNFGVELFVLDNLTKLMRMLVDTRDNENFTISKIITGLEMLAKELNIYICIVSHVRKEDSSGKSYEGGKVMRSHDLYGSGDISKFAHNVIAIARNNDLQPNETTYHLIKSRRGSLGCGNVLTFSQETGRMKVLENI